LRRLRLDFLLREEAMRKLSGAAVAIIVGVALYFSLSWGADALRTFTSPTYGLDDVWRSQFIFAIGRLFSLGPIGLIKLAAFFGALKLAVAAFCAVHILDRARALIGGTANSDVFEGALVLVVLISIASVGPAVLSQSAELVREDTIQLMLAAIAIALCLVERSYRGAAENANPTLATDLAATPRGAPWYAPFR
jgi:hypothetical protein